MAAEFRLLCIAVRWPQQAEDAEALRRAAAGAPDWQVVVEAAKRHCVTRLVFSALQDCGSPQIPREALDKLRQRSIGETCRSLAQIAEIVRLSSAFTAAGVRVLVLKGAALSFQLYGDPALRPARDIDFLVHPEDVERADTLLIAAGYKSPWGALHPRQKAIYAQRVKEFEYFHATTNECVELHHRLTDDPLLLPWDFNTLWSEREELRVGGVVFATLRPSQLRLYLCVHGALHGWERLRWLLDLATLLEQTRGTSAALAEAEAAGLGPVMQQAIALAHDWFGFPIAEKELSRALANPRVKSLNRILGHLLAGSVLGNLPKPGTPTWLYRYSVWLRIYRLALKPDWRHWRQQMAREWVSPADWKFVRLPSALFWLYPIIRPVLWLARQWQK